MFPLSQTSKLRLCYSLTQGSDGLQSHPGLPEPVLFPLLLGSMELRGRGLLVWCWEGDEAKADGFASQEDIL